MSKFLIVIVLLMMSTTARAGSSEEFAREIAEIEATASFGAERCVNLRFNLSAVDAILQATKLARSDVAAGGQFHELYRRALADRREYLEREVAGKPLPSVCAAFAKAIPFKGVLVEQSRPEAGRPLSDAIPDQLIRTADRTGISAGANFTSIRCDETICRWDAGDGIEVSADARDLADAHRLEVNWSNARAGTTGRSSLKFESLCTLLVATIDSTRDGKQARALARKLIQVGQSTNGDRDVSFIEDGVTWWGSRSVPARPTLKGQAFRQCGVSR